MTSNFGGQTGRRLRQLQYISEYATDIRYVKGEHNEIADCSSCPPDINAVFRSWETTDLSQIAAAQSSDEGLTRLLQSPPDALHFVQVCLRGSESLLLVDI